MLLSPSRGAADPITTSALPRNGRPPQRGSPTIACRAGSDRNSHVVVRGVRELVLPVGLFAANWRARGPSVKQVIVVRNAREVRIPVTLFRAMMERCRASPIPRSPAVGYGTWLLGYKNGDQAIPPGLEEDVSWPVLSKGPNWTPDPYFFAPATGMYRIVGEIVWAFDGVGYRQLVITVQGIPQCMVEKIPGNGHNSFTQIIEHLLPLTQGQGVQFYVFQLSGSTYLNIRGPGTFGGSSVARSFFSIQRTD